MRTSQDGIKLIKDFEGCKLAAYQDSANCWTIGYGHTKDVSEGMTITSAQANAFLADDLQEFEHYVNAYVIVPLTQNQFDALVSFTYNLGPGNFRHSDLLSFINAGRFNQAAATFVEYDQSDGIEIAGLKRRRQAEQTMFVTPDRVLDFFDKVVRWFRK